MSRKHRVALLHGAGYAGGELIRILLNHPSLSLQAATSRSFAGNPIWHAHPHLKGQTDLVFSDPKDVNPHEFEGLLVSGEHGQSASLLAGIIRDGYEGCAVDLSADFRLKTAEDYLKWYKFDHPHPDLLDQFVYGMPEIRSPYPTGTRFIANPGCFATGIGLSIWPLSLHLPPTNLAITALTGASGSGARPKATTHYPTRDGNVRAYKVLSHQHLGEINYAQRHTHTLSFVPVSGPWTRGIWGTVQAALPSSVSESDVHNWYHTAYDAHSLVRLWPNALPELRVAARTPFADIGWIIKDHQLVVGFAIDNLLKGAASQAVQNLNILFGLPDTLGLTPTPASSFTE